MREISLKITDIDCAACVDRLNRSLLELPGVLSAGVNYAAGRALISYDETVTDIAAIATRVKRAGYGVPADRAELKFGCLDEERARHAGELLMELYGVKSVEADLESASLDPWSRPVCTPGRRSQVWCGTPRPSSGCSAPRFGYPVVRRC